MSTVLDSIWSAVESIWSGADQTTLQDNYNLAVATATQESGLNTKAVGDNGTSFGLFQLHEGGELGSLTATQAFDPYTNAVTALSRFKSVEQQNPTLLSSNPGEVAALAQRPANPSSYAQKVNALLGTSSPPSSSSSSSTTIDTSSIGDFFTKAGLFLVGAVLIVLAIFVIAKDGRK